MDDLLDGIGGSACSTLDCTKSMLLVELSRRVNSVKLNLLLPWLLDSELRCCWLSEIVLVRYAADGFSPPVSS